jgi:mycoredoxin
MPPIKLYGATWCGDTRRSRRVLDDLAIPHEYHDVDRNLDAKKWAIAQNGGKQKIPVIQLGQTILIEPTDTQLESALRSVGHLAP